MTDIFLVFIALGVVAAFSFAVVMNRLRRTKATYNMYAVRDELIHLVSSGVLSEDSAVFKHYYKRTNMLLQFAPNIGIDQAYKAFLFLKNNSKVNLDEAFEKAKQETDNILNSKELEIPEVSKTVESFYSSYSEMVLSHSSATRFIYYATRHKVLNIDAVKKAPVRLQKAVGMVSFSNEEIDQIYEKRNFCS
ncbi:hypothetical protein ABIA54_003320 [Pseudomonas sp. EB276 TE3739]|uniref:hypothetical protein n=1 Tax=Pseudomonas TaxID=286 RepID=UPI00209F0591|nr:hypothetical protein [Pseudomonas koreensis]MCP1472597.1 hypothetical protein [Pseudomonas koreensis]